jgi:hypothetical protein
MRSDATQKLSAPALGVTIKGKEFHRCHNLSREADGGSGPLKTETQSRRLCFVPLWMLASIRRVQTGSAENSVLSNRARLLSEEH